MKIDLNNLTFMIPVRIDSSDRLRNLFLSVSYILKNFDTNIIIKESDSVSILQEKIPNLLENKRVIYFFDKHTEQHFERTRIINDMILESKTDIVVNYDADILLPLESYFKSKILIEFSGYDIVYPFRHGAKGEVKAKFKDENINYLDNPEELQNNSLYKNDFNLDEQSGIDFFYSSHPEGPGYANFGMCQFFKKSSYINGYMENENFIAYAPEDKERFYRFKTLGYKIARIEEHALHLEHSRNHNSSNVNPFMTHNNKLWDFLSKLSKEQIEEYYSKQEYYKKRINS